MQPPDRHSDCWKLDAIMWLMLFADRLSQRDHPFRVQLHRCHSGTGELLLGSKAQTFRAVEIGDGEKVPILRAYLKRWKAEVGVFFSGVSADSPEPELQRIAPDHPVFRVEAATPGQS